MLFKTHLAFSFLLFMILWPVFDIQESKWVFAIIWIVSSIIADIDSANSTIGKFFKPIGWLSRHRGFFHSFFPAVLLSLLVWLLSPNYSIAVFLGYTSHLFLDIFNHQGVALFYPFLKYRLKGPIKTGGIIERILFLLFLAGIIILSL